MEHFTQDGHLSETGMAHCVDALKLRQEEQLPEAVRAHLAGCTACMHEVAGLYAALAEVDYTDDLAPAGPKAAEPAAASRWWRLGLMLAVAALSWWMYQRQSDAPLREQPQRIAPQPILPAATDSLAPRRPIAAEEGRKAPTAPNPTLPHKTPDEPTATATDAMTLYAANFEPDEDWEGLVGGVVRGEGPAEIQPAIAARFKPGERITFSWKSTATNWKLKIYNNKGKVLAEQPAVAGMKWTAPELPGLYYWSLENEADLQYVGKFAVIR